MKREITRIKGDRFCTLEINLETRANDTGSPGKSTITRLSLTGSAGEVVSRADAKRRALAYWESYFDESPDERRALAEKFEKHFRTARGAARFVLSVDGEFHGLDVTREDGDDIYLAHSFGQIREEIAEFFPEAVPYFRWHLNDMKAECEHQEARGETWTKNPGAVCPDCGYKLGSRWLARELPDEVVEWARTFGEAES